MDTRTERAIPEDTHISIGEDYEIHYWTARLGCTSRELRQAVVAAGSKATDVVAYLREHADA